MKIDTVKISEQMEKKGFRKIDLARASGVDYNNLVNALRRRSTSETTAEKIAAALGCSVWDIERGADYDDLPRFLRRKADEIESYLVKYLERIAEREGEQNDT